MATNLRAKLPKSDTLIIHDLNSEATAKFVKENQGTEIATSVRELAERSVCPHVLTRLHPSYKMNYCSIYDLSWGLPCAALSLIPTII